MEYMMKIGDAVEIPSVGYIIIGNNPEVTKYNTSNLCRKGSDIIVECEGEKLKFKVLDIQLTFSISEKVIINLQVEKNDSFEKIKPGSFVYKI